MDKSKLIRGNDYWHHKEKAATENGCGNIILAGLVAFMAVFIFAIVCAFT